MSTPTLCATKHSVTDGQTNRQTLTDIQMTSRCLSYYMQFDGLINKQNSWKENWG